MIDELKDVDLYELLGVLQSATVDEVKSSYRKKALKCHPDKNPDNPKAAEEFHQLSKALEVLIDESARAAYDKVINAKNAAKLRHKELDSKRRKFKEDLERREKEAELASKRSTSNYSVNKSDEDKFKAEVERLRKEGSRQVQEEIELVRQQVLQEQQNLAAGSRPVPTEKKIKVRWNSSKDDKMSDGYDSENLNKFFSKYGDIEALIISSKKKGSALIEFSTADAADKASKYERGLLSNPLTVELISSVKSAPSVNRTFGYSNITPGNTLFPSTGSPGSTNSSSVHQNNTFTSVNKSGFNTDYESLVLRQLRQAEERKRLIEELKKES